jgi:hypothetical protein
VVSIGQKTRIGRLKIRVDRVIYTTITLLCVLIIYDGWEQLQFLDVVAVILGPIVAIFLSHVFGAALGTRVALGRALSRHERRAVFVEECRFLLIPVLPLAILVVLAIAGVSYTRIIQVIVLTGCALARLLGRRGRTASRPHWLGAGVVDRLRPLARRHHLGAPGDAPARERPLSSIRAASCTLLVQTRTEPSG